MEAEQLDHEFVEGTGTPLVFIHGWLGSKNDWQKVRRKLEIDNPMLFYDQRCHGNSECEEFTFDDLAEDLKTLIEKFQLKDPVLVGHSMGGMVALTYATSYDNFSGLFLIGTSASTPEPENGSPKYFLKQFGEKDREKWAEEIVENYVGNGKPESENMAFNELANAPEEPIIYGLESMIDYDVRQELQEIETRANVVSGAHDKAITEEKSKELAELMDAKLLEADSSHLLTFERPGIICSRLEEFISQ